MFKNEKKRFLSLLLAILVFISGIPLEVYAIDSTPIDGITVTHDGKYDSNTRKVTVTANSTKVSCDSIEQVTKEITVKNTSKQPIQLEFKYTSSGCADFSITNVTNPGNSGDFSKKIEAEGVVTITFKTSTESTSTEAKVELYDFNIPEEATKYNINVAKPENGNIAVTGVEYQTVNGAYIFSADSSTEVTLTATPVNGYSFFAWVNGENKIISESATYKFYPSGNNNLKAMFVKANSDCAVFGAGTNFEQKFVDLGDAVNYASSNANKVVTLLSDGTISGNYTIPAGITLLIPYSDANEVYGAEPPYQTYDGKNHPAPTEFRTLTMEAGASLTINGTLEVGGVHTSGQGRDNTTGNPTPAGSPTGDCGFIKMRDNSEIVVYGKAYVWGFITGTGKVTAKDGAAIYENLQVTDYRGGRATINCTDKKVFPFSQYYVQNVEVEEVIEYGATVSVCTTIKASILTESSVVAFIGPVNSKALFTMTSGKVTKKYNGSKDRLEISSEGDVSMSPMSISVELININSNDYPLPITSNISVNAISGTISMKQDLLLLPGAEINLNESAKLKMIGGKSIYVIDAATWEAKQYLWSHSGKKYVPVSNAPGRTTNRNTKKGSNAKIDINGEVILENGYVYATSNATDITSSKECGKITFKNNDGAGAGTTVTLGTQSDTAITANSITVSPVKLKNGTNSSLGTHTDTKGAEKDTTFSWYKTYEDQTLNGWAKECTVEWYNENDTTPFLIENQVPLGAKPIFLKFTADKDSETVTLNDEQLPTKKNDAQYYYAFDNSKWKIYGTDTQITDDTKVEKLVEKYTAGYTPIERTYTVQWIDEDETGKVVELEKDEGVSYGANSIAKYDGNPPTKQATADKKYSFIGWSMVIPDTEVVSEELRKPIIDANGEPVHESFPVYEGYICQADIEEGTVDKEAIITYKANYAEEEQGYIVKWIDGDGKVLATSPEESLLSATDVVPEYPGTQTPTKTADAQFTYTFAGWDIDGDRSVDDTSITKTIEEVVSDIEKKNSEVIIEAVFDGTLNKYTVKWVDEDGTTVLDKQQVEYGTKPVYSKTIPSKAATAQYTYTFAGWDPVITEVTGDATYTATYKSTVNEYTVIWATEDGVAIETDTNVPYGTVPEFNGNTPSKAGNSQYSYTFSGWNKEVEEVTGDVTYTATFEKITNKYTIKWVDEDDTELETQTLEYGATPVYSKAEPTKAATAQYTYTFAGWDKNIVTVTGEATYKATYDAVVNEYDIKWVDEDGTELETQTLKYGATPVYSKANPTKSSTAQYTYTFAGWSPTITTVTGEAVYTATYNSVTNKYKITWLNEDGSEVLGEDLVEYGTTPIYKGDTPTKAGNIQYSYKHSGWTPTVVSVEKAATYTATFEEIINKYTIKWVDEDGTTVLDEQQVEYGATPIYSKANPTKSATAQYTYTFAGWDNDIEKVTGPAIIIARYTAEVNSYTITWLNEDGTELYSQDVKYGEMPVYDGETPSKEATAQYKYKHSGWTPTVVSVEKAATYTATFEEITNKYTVKWVDEDGTTVLDEQQVEYGAKPVYSKTTPSKAATAQYTYMFAGWDNDIEKVTGPATITAAYTAEVNSYTIEWVNEDGTELYSQDVKYGEMPVYHGETPSKEATAQYTYKHSGWTPEIAAVTGEATYTATYTSTVNEYTVTWLNEDGTELDKQILAYGTMPEYTKAEPSKAATAQYTYTFAGWDKAFSEVKADVTYTATYTLTVNKYTVTWVNDGEVIKKDENVAYGVTPGYVGETPTKEADAQYTYMFAGWSPTISAVEKDVTYTAVYNKTVNTYTVKWVNEDGTTLETDANVEYGETPIYNREDPEKESDAQYHYTFAGWDKDVAEVTENVTYTATYTSELRSYTITWLNDNGTELDKQILVYGTTPTYTKVEPTKAATAQYTYTFAGWDKDIVEVNADATYTATYTSTTNAYTVTWTDENNQVVEVDKNVLYGTLPTYDGTELTKAEDEEHYYVNDGWTPAVSTVTGDITYKVVFKEVPKGQYTITFDTLGGSGVDTIVEFENSDIIKPADPTKKGYTFAGWLYEGQIIEIPEKMPAYHMALTAKWTINQYTITFDTDGGTEIKAITQDYDTEIQAVANPSKEGYTFAGWDVAIPNKMPAEDLTLTAKWTVNQYTITFNTDGGTPVRAITQDYNTEIQAVADPSKEGYTFAGWDVEIPETMPAKNVTITATWTINQYTITFDTDGGTEINPITQDYNTAVSRPSNPTKTGYTFAGWIYDGKQVQIPDAMPAENMTLTASWRINQYTINFDTDGGTEIKAITQDYDTEIQAVANPSKEGYTFAGWDVEIPGTMPANHMTITAQWTINQYTITFDTDGGNTIDPITQDFASKVTKPADPTKTGYTFAGWSQEIPGTMPAKDINVTAKWTINQYTITFDTNGGTTIPAIKQDYMTDVTAPADPVREGYTFAGWDVAVPETMAAENVTITAKWTINQYTITFNTAGGSAIEAITQDYDTEVTAPADPVREGYTFAGWDKEIPETMPAESVTITAKWTINQYTITFDTAGGNAIAAIKQNYGTTVTAPADPTKEGYKFVGWDKEIPETMPAENVTITASWEIQQYWIIFDTDGGTDIPTIVQNYGTSITAPADPVKTGHTFVGWDVEIPKTMPGKETCVKALWKINKYTITFETDGGNSILPITQDYGTEITAPANPTKTGHTFAGWDREIPETMPAENITITAQWTINEYTITFSTDGGTAIEPLKLTYGENLVKPADPVKEGYTFNGWDLDFTGTMPPRNLTANAQWTINQYTIRFNTDGGSTIAPIIQNYGTKVTAPENPTKAGYEFVEWDTEIPATMPAENVVITAKWSTNQYTIIFDTDGGTEISPITQDYNTSVTAPADPTKEGYTFDGWDARIPATMPAENVTITAKWKINQYSIIFDTDGGNYIEEIVQDYNSVIATPADPTKTGYTFAGWDKEIPETMPAESLRIKALWKVNQYTITFNTDGGNEVDSITQDYNTTIVTPKDPTKTGHTFAGWETEIPAKMPANNVTIKAKWNVNQYTISFDTDGGNAIEAITQDYGTAVIVPKDPMKDGHTFAGWDKEIPDTIPAENITVKACWTVNSYDIRWDINGDGIVDDTTSVKYGEMPIHEDGSKEADAHYTYTFTGWSPEISAVKDHITYTAQFAKTVNKYDISWDTDGDGIVDEVTSVAYGSIPVHVDGMKPTDEMYEYTFTGWDQKLTPVEGEKTYTAQFSTTPIEYTLTFDTKGGTFIVPEVIAYGGEITKPADPEKTGYTFAGWDKEIPETMPAKDLIISALWTVNQYTLTFDIDDGESGDIEAITQDYGTAITAPEPPIRTGYTFDGWSPALPVTMPATNMELSATWRINQYTITYDTDGGSEVKSVTQDYDSVVPLPEEPTKVGHTFIGWDIKTPKNMPAHNMTITALWEVNEYTLTFVTEEGEEPYAVVTQNYGTDIAFPADPEKEGYIFGGWSPEIGSKMPDEDKTLEAVWNINQYTIIFDTDGGNLISSITADYEAEIEAPEAPRKTGYTFVGWDKEIPETMPAENMTIKALWEVNQYTISFNTDGGSEIAPITQDYGTVIVIPDAPTKAGYTFAGWDMNIPARMPAVDLNVTAYWYINEYTITFNTNGGSELEPITAYFEDYLEEPEAPTKEGYAFAGWDQEFPETMPAGGMTLNAQWVAVDYAISWDLDGDGTVDDITMVPYDSMPSHEDGEKASILEYSYKFTGWSPELTEVKGSVTYTAQFEAVPNEFTIHFDTDGGSEVEDMKCAYGATASEPEAPTKVGYTFNGWYPALPESMPAENITLVAQWKANEYTIKFDTAGGTVVGDITAEFGSAISEPTEPTKEGHTFIGWDIEFPEKMGSEDMTLTAQWKVNQYTIKFDTDGGTEIDAITQDYGTAITAPENPVKEHHEFLGWNIEIPDTMQANDITITAQWKYVYTGWLDEEGGTTYLIRGSKEYYNEWADIDGHKYFFDADSYILRGVNRVMDADGSFEAYFIFDSETGIFLEETNGLFDYQGETYLAKEGYLVEYPGLVKVGDDYYYFNSKSVAIKDCKYWITKTNGLMLKGSYDFDKTGKIKNPKPFSEGQDRDGIVNVDGTLCYFKDGDLYYAGLIKVDGNYYYVKSTGELAVSQKYWATKTNGLMPQASYKFDEEGKIVNPKVYPSQISLNKTEISVNKGKTYTLKSFFESEANDAEVVTKVTWTTSDKKVATVNSNGRITAVGKGTVIITVKTANGLTASCEVTVLIPATKVILNKTSLTINTGKTYQLKATMSPKTTTDTLTWVSSDENIVTVSEDGQVTAVGKGKATITVKTTSGKKAVCKVTVK